MRIDFKEDLTEEQKKLVFASNKFQNWIKKLEDSEIKVEKIDVYKVNFFGNKVGFIYAEAFSTINGKIVPGISFIRGDSVTVLIIFNVEGKKYFLSTKQYRVPIAKWDIDLVAGMMDEDNEFKSVALKELYEETGIDIHIKEEELKLLFSGDISGGGSDECSTAYVYETEIDKETLNRYNGTTAGNINENENIIIDIKPFEELKELTGIRSQLAYYKYKEMQ